MRRDPLLHPAFLVACCVLWLNDHAWKTEYPGLWTGKLSDLAGLFMLPFVVDGVVRRLGSRSMRLVELISVAGAVWFALANLWSPAQRAFEHVFGLARWLLVLPATGVQGLPIPPIRAVALTPDPSDLLALPAVGLGLWLVRRLRAHPS